jgi:4-amino-4-deoxy-L-arabinose transferase-like glycosyltransferase
MRLSGILGRLRGRLGRSLLVLVSLQVAAIVVVGGVTVARFHVFAPIDERQHFAYVQEVAEHERLPHLGRDLVSWQIQAINDRTYPRRSPRDPRLIGLAGQSYEAFQPPLYYIVATPAFLVAGSNYRHKVTAVRAFDLVLLLTAVAALALLARAVFAGRWLIPFSLGLSVLSWPGVIVRTVTVSNAALELPLVLLYVYALWQATARRSSRWLAAAGALFGLCILTHLMLVALAPLLAVPAIALLREHRTRRAVAAVAVALALPALLLTPWLASNENRYDALTPSALAKRVQGPYVNPSGKGYGLSDVASRLGRLPKAALPQEWWPEYGRRGLGIPLRLLPGLLVLFVLVPIALRPGLLRTRAAALLGSPLPLVIAMLVGIVVIGDWPSFTPRYLYPTLPPLALFAARGWRAARRRDDSLLALAAGSTAIAWFAWLYLAGAYYFIDAGAALGIHAAGQ